MKNRIVFPGLNELRAFAAFAVVFHHVELYKKRIGISSLYDTKLRYCLEHLGHNGVFLFFVLSGFLITYLLLSEIKINDRVSLRNFYARRILRIWPLYYIIVLLSFFIVPYAAGFDFFSKETHYMRGILSLNLGMNLVLFIFFLSNLAMIIYTPVVGASQSWSVSVEEQFYAIWPLLMNIFKKRPWIAFVGVIVLKPTVMYGLAWLNNHYLHNDTIVTVVRFLNTLDIELMAIGGLGAWFFFNHKEKVETIFSDKKYFLVIVTLLAVQLFMFSFMFILGFTFLALILFFICRKISFPVFNFFGTISYGIYMYHPLVMFLSYAIVNQSSIENPVLYNVLVYTMVLGGTIGISYLSFHLIEKRFLSLKEKFSIVLSGKVSDRL
jgi:peptidoglycan/LPS O-acetylase OafA/YrhL